MCVRAVGRAGPMYQNISEVRLVCCQETRSLYRLVLQARGELAAILIIYHRNATQVKLSILKKGKKEINQTKIAKSRLIPI